MPTQRRVIMLDQFGAIGGGQRILLDLVNALRARGWITHLLCPAGPLAQEGRKRGAQVHIIALPDMQSGHKSILSMFHAWMASRRIARAHRALALSADLIIVNGPRTLAIARTWVRSLGKPAVVYLHGLYGGIENFLLRSFLRLPRTAAVAASPIIAEPFATLSNVHRIHNWVSAEFLGACAVPKRLRSVLGIVDRDPIILIPGRFSPNKGQLIALEASKLLADAPCHFVFSGSVLFEERGRSVAEALRRAADDQPQRVHVIDWSEHLPSLFDGADLVLVPSLWEEPFGLTAIEAMARLRPLIVTDRGMLPLLADGGRVACVVSPTPLKLANAIRDFLAHRDAWTRRAEEARKEAERNFHPEKQQGAVMQLCASLLRE